MLTLDKWPGLPDKPLEPHMSNYADFSVPVKNSFPWEEIHDAIDMPMGAYVATAFRSESNPGFEMELLRIDELVVEVTRKKPGSLFYFPFLGLSICGWEDLETTINAIDSPEHDLAIEYAKVAYKKVRKEQFTVVRWIVGGSVELLPKEDFYAVKDQFAVRG